MNDHDHFKDLLPQYAAGSLDEHALQEVGRHIKLCAECQTDLQLWTALSAEIRAQNEGISPPANLSEEVLRRVQVLQIQTESGARTPWRAGIQWGFDLLVSQAPLVRRELWPASAIVILIGVAVAYLLGNYMVIGVLAPLVAAASLAVLYGPENDPAIELAMSCPTSLRQILLARVALVFGYNLVMALLASLVTKSLAPPGFLGSLILSWLGPMAFLSATALLLSIWIGTNNAITLTYIAWMAQFVPDLQLPGVSGLPQWLAPAAQAYQQFWSSPTLLLASAFGLLVLAIFSTARSDQKLPHWA
jgi:anti-sigma factor RsiW